MPTSVTPSICPNFSEAGSVGEAGRNTHTTPGLFFLVDLFNGCLLHPWLHPLLHLDRRRGIGHCDVRACISENMNRKLQNLQADISVTPGP
jgi:hypothetical protein